MNMYHDFKPAQLDATKCLTCKRPQDKHTCEVCNSSESKKLTLKYGTILMCEPCAEREDNLQAERVKPENVQARVDALNNGIKAAQQIDNSIRIASDIFNAKTVAIVELEKAINEDSTIQNKPYALAEQLTNRLTHLKQVIFELNKQVTDANSEQKAIQVYLNTRAHQLRAEEREKLHIQDINYKPTAVKTVKVSQIKAAKKKFDPVELKRLAAEINMPESTIQLFALQKNMTIEQVGNLLRKTINESKSMTQPK